MVTSTVRRNSKQYDRTGMILGLGILASGFVPWVVSSGQTSTTVAGQSFASTTTGLDFPFATYLYSGGSGIWLTLSALDYLAIVLLVFAGLLVLMGAASTRYRGATEPGAVTAALAPIVFFGLSYVSGGPFTFSVLSVFRAPVGAFFPVLLGVWVEYRKGVEEGLVQARQVLEEVPTTIVATTPSVSSTGSQSARFCHWCGSNLLQSARFCQNCGRQLTSER